MSDTQREETTRPLGQAEEAKVRDLLERHAEELQDLLLGQSMLLMLRDTMMFVTLVEDPEDGESFEVTLYHPQQIRMVDETFLSHGAEIGAFFQ